MSKKRATISFGRMLALASPLLLFSALAAVFFYQLQSGKDTSEIPSALIGKPVPTFNLSPLAGLKRDGVLVQGLNSTDLVGQVSLVNIFASWCVPCRAEHPVLIKLAEDKTINIVGINYKDKPGNALRFLGGLGNPYARVGVDPKGRTAIEWGFYGIPETLLVDRKGIVRYKVVGPINAAKYKALLEEIKKLR
ncbi:MAG: DsbE family thiol:disulfide interchange protein [Rhizobiaceae bacterium]